MISEMNKYYQIHWFALQQLGLFSSQLKIQLHTSEPLAPEVSEQEN